MTLNYTSVECWKSSIPNIENSNPRIIFFLDNESRKCLQSHLGINTWDADLSILADERLFLTKSEYDYNKEEWHESVLKEFNDKDTEKIIEAIDNMLSEEPCGPGGRPLFTSFASIVSYLTRRSSGPIANGLSRGLADERKKHRFFCHS